MTWWSWLLTGLGAWLALSVIAVLAFALGAHIGRGESRVSLLRPHERRFLGSHRWN